MGRDIQSEFRITAPPLIQMSTVCLALLSVSSVLAQEGSTKPGWAGMVDRLHDRHTSQISGTSARFDNFFVTDEYATYGDNETRLRFRLNTDYIEGHGWEFTPNVKLNLELPGISNRLRLVANDADKDNEAGNAVDSTEEPDLAFRWVATNSDRVGVSFDVGARYKDSETSVFGRINTALRYPIGKNWTGVTSNRLYYYSDTKLRNDFRQYFDHTFNENLMIRSRTRIEYLEEDEYNPQWEQKFVLFQRIDPRISVAYEAILQRYSIEESAFDPEDLEIPLQNNFYAAQLRLRFRRNFWRPWLFAEIWPVLAWPEERDFKTTPAIRFRLEINWGNNYAHTQQIDED